MQVNPVLYDFLENKKYLESNGFDCESLSLVDGQVHAIFRPRKAEPITAEESVEAAGRRYDDERRTENRKLLGL